MGLVCVVGVVGHGLQFGLVGGACIASRWVCGLGLVGVVGVGAPRAQFTIIETYIVSTID